MQIEEIIKQATGASKLIDKGQIQELWSGYGAIRRFQTVGGSHESVIIKHISLPENTGHPRGWNTKTSHQRKLRSYQIETSWYQQWASRCDARCYVPDCIAVKTHNSDTLLILEDLDASGFSV